MNDGVHVNFSSFVWFKHLICRIYKEKTIFFPKLATQHNLETKPPLKSLLYFPAL